MVAQEVDRTGTRAVAGPALDRGEGYCPECGQSLDLSRRSDEVALGVTRGRWPFAIVGLCLILLFGVRAWQARAALVALDRQIAGSAAAMRHDVFGSPSDQARAQAAATAPLVLDRAPLRRRLQGDLAGLALGLLGLVAGADGRVPSLLGFGRRRGPDARGPGRPSRASPVGLATRLAATGMALAGSCFQVLFILFGCCVATRLVRGVPPTLDLIDHALARTLEMVIAGGDALR